MFQSLGIYIWNRNYCFPCWCPKYCQLKRPFWRPQIRVHLGNYSIFSKTFFSRKLDRIVHKSEISNLFRKSLARKSWFFCYRNILLILFAKQHSISMYLISSNRLQSIISWIPTFKCDSLLEEADIFKFQVASQWPRFNRNQGLQITYLETIALCRKTTQINPVKDICLWTRNICNYKSPSFSNHCGHKIYEIHWEKGCTLEYCNTLSALKK